MKTFILALAIVMPSITSAQQQYTIVFLNKKTEQVETDKAEVEKIMKGHMDNMQRLHGEGKLVAAGPLHGGGGIFILNTTSVEEAKEWISTDPGVQAKRWDIEILSFRPVTGNICAVKEPYEMVSYQLIRYSAVKADFVFSSGKSRWIKTHDDYVKKSNPQENVVTYATFDDEGNGLVILKSEITEDIIAGDPTIQSKMLKADIKKLYIAKGSFCEK